MLALCIVARGVDAGEVRAEDYRSFWLWAGVKPQPVLDTAEEIYLLAGEVREGSPPRIASQRSATPRVKKGRVWIVYRAQTILWDEAVFSRVLHQIEEWREAGNDIAGLQIDFDAGSKSLDRYASFLSGVRTRLPQRYKLGVTGLLDWSANGDPAGLVQLAGVVDEVVLQIYQGRRVIPGYAGYLRKLDILPMSFKVGLLQGGEWTPPSVLDANPRFQGYVVFLLNP